VEKDAFLGTLWEKFTDLFRTEDERSKRRVNFLLSDKKDPGRWESLPRNASSTGFVKAVGEDPRADTKLKKHVQSLHDLSKSPTVAKIDSSSKSGRSYEVKQLPGGRLGCTCNDWRFKGTVDPSHKCKHIRAFEAGMSKAATFSAQTSAFFDEFSKIRDATSTDRQKMRAARTSSLLDEPVSDFVPEQIEDEDPEVTSRRFGKLAERLTKKEKRKRDVKFLALGMGSGPVVAATRNIVSGPRVTDIPHLKKMKPGQRIVHLATGGSKLKRWLPASVATGAVISGAVPALRRQIEKGIAAEARERRKKGK
jgi:hypothetical protein